jgi:hypothetical protein
MHFNANFWRNLLSNSASRVGLSSRRGIATARAPSAPPRAPRLEPTAPSTSGSARAFPDALRCPRPRAPEVGRTPRQLVARARHAPRRRHTGPPLPAQLASSYALLPAVTSLLCSSEATVESPLAPIEPPVFPRHALARRRARLAPPPVSIATAASSASSCPHSRPTPQAPLLGSVEAQAATPRPVLRRPSPDGRSPRLPLGCAAVGHHRPSLCPV